MALEGSHRAEPEGTPSLLKAVVGCVAALCLIVGFVFVLFKANSGDGKGPDSAKPAPTAAGSDIPAPADKGTVRIASLNVLSAKHTVNGRSVPRIKKNKPAPKVEVDAAELVGQLASRRGLDVLGLQTFGQQGLKDFQAARKGWAVFPLDQPKRVTERSAIAWRTSKWHRVRAKVVHTKLTDGSTVHTPYVLLRNVQTQREVYVVNVPSSRRSLADPILNGKLLVERLGAQGTSVVMTGAANARSAREKNDSTSNEVEVEQATGPFAGDAESPVQAAMATLPAEATSFDFRVGSYNLLGASHTAPGGNKKGWAGAITRMDWAMQEIRGAGLTVVGFQEFQFPQQGRFRQLTGGGWGLYPGTSMRQADGDNSIGWNSAVWELVEAHTEPIPYFGGGAVNMPYIKLKDKASGQEVWFANFHNPATTSSHGNNAHWRSVATGKEIALANRLGADGTPVVFTGDMNEKEEFFCPVVAQTELISASGGSTGDGPCAPAGPVQIDWILGSGMTFSNYGIVNGARRASDHRLIVATANAGQNQPRAEMALGDMAIPSDQSIAGLDAFAPAAVRIRYTYELLDEADVDVIGFQELTSKQLAGFRTLAGDSWKLYPGARLDDTAAQSSIGWRTDTWREVKAANFPVRASRTTKVRIPYVLLESLETGEQIYVVNTYNPVRTVGTPSGAWAEAADQAVMAKVDKLRRSGIPVVVTGGLNGESGELCRLSRKHQLISPSTSPSPSPSRECGRPSDDQIFGTRGMRFSNFNVTHAGLVQKATDAPLVTVDADLSR